MKVQFTFKNQKQTREATLAVKHLNLHGSAFFTMLKDMTERVSRQQKDSSEVPDISIIVSQAEVSKPVVLSRLFALHTYLLSTAVDEEDVDYSKIEVSLAAKIPTFLFRGHYPLWR